MEPVTNSFIDVLQKATETDQIKAREPTEDVKSEKPPVGHLNQREVKVEIYNSQGKIEKVSAFILNPYHTNWWRKLLCWIKEQLFGRLTIQVKVEGESEQLYMRVDELSKVLKTPPKELRKQFSVVDATDKLIKHNIKRTIDAIQRIAVEKGVRINPNFRKKLELVSAKVPYKNVYKILDPKILDSQFDSAAMIQTLLAIGTRCQSSTVQKGHCENGYEYVINEGNILISTIQDNKKIQIDLGSLEKKETPLPSKSLKNRFVETAATIRERIQKSVLKQSNPMQMTTEMIALSELNQLAKKSGLEFISPKVTNRIKPENLLSILEGTEDEEERIILLRTFVEIGKVLQNKPKKSDSIYRDKTEEVADNENAKTLTYPFSIFKDRIFVVTNYLDEGSYKKVTEAINLNNLEEEWVCVEVNASTVEEGQEDTTIPQTQLEATRLAELKKNNPYLMEPYAYQILTNSQKLNEKDLLSKSSKNQPIQDKLILFQWKYNKTAATLSRSSTLHILSAMKDVATGLGLIHDENCVHGDIKLKNIVLEGDISSQVPVKAKIGDVGLLVEQGTIIRAGTLPFLPEEAILRYSDEKGQEKFSINVMNYKAQPSLDSFSLGICILALLDEYGVIHKISIKKPDYVLGILSQEEMGKLIDNIKTQVNLWSDLNEKDKAAQLQLLEVARGLTIKDPALRLTCKKAATQLQIAQDEFSKA